MLLCSAFRCHRPIGGDREFCRRLQEFGLVDGALLAERLAAVDGLGPAVRERVDEIIRSQPPTR